MRIKLGYSCWGFLGKGIIDTPDGGRSHRYTLITELISRGVDIVMLQKDRDLLETGENFSNEHLKFRSDLPKIDALFLEYRWKIPGRNYEVNKADKEYAPDFDRQSELLDYYKLKGIPILIWDKDQKLSNKEIKIKNSIIFEPALSPRFKRKSLLFPLNKKMTERAIKKVNNYSQSNRSIQLVYIGNQYERDKSFEKYIDLPAGLLNIHASVYGNWTKYLDKYGENLKDFPNIEFKGMISFNKVYNLYSKSLMTVLIAPDIYYKTGHYTQRLFECLWNLCIPVVPREYKFCKKVIIKEWIVSSSNDVVRVIDKLNKQGVNEIKELFKKQFGLLKLFDADQQAKKIIREITNFYGRSY